MKSTPKLNIEIVKLITDKMKMMESMIFMIQSV